MGRRFIALGLSLLMLAALAFACLWILRPSFPGLSAPENSSHIVAMILEFPEIPDPHSVEYADCLAVAKVQVLHVSRGERVPRELLVAIPVISKRVLTKAAAYKSGDYLELVLLNQEQVDEHMHTMQRIMEVDDFDLMFMYAADSLHWKRQAIVSQLSGNDSSEPLTGNSRAVTTISFQDERNSHSRRVRDNVISDSKSRIQSLLNNHGGSWQQWVADVEPWRKKLNALARDSGGGIIRDGLFFKKLNGHRYQELNEAGENAPAFRMILALHKELDLLGIDLIVVPFPFKEEVHGDHFLAGGPDDGVLVPERLHLVYNLLEAGVEVLDLTEALRVCGETGKLFYPYGDTHPADGGIRIAAAEIADRLKRYRFSPDVYGLKTHLTEFTMPEEFQKRRDSSYPFMPLDPTFPATIVETVSGARVPAGSMESPLVLLGDSFTRCPNFYGCSGASIRDHLAYVSGVNPASLSIHGSAGQTMANLALEGRRFLVHRQVAVFVFSSSRLFVQHHPDDRNDSDWKVVPFADKFRE